MTRVTTYDEAMAARTVWTELIRTCLMPQFLTATQIWDLVRHEYASRPGEGISPFEMGKILNQRYVTRMKIKSLAGCYLYTKYILPAYRVGHFQVVIRSDKMVSCDLPWLGVAVDVWRSPGTFAHLFKPNRPYIP